MATFDKLLLRQNPVDGIVLADSLLSNTKNPSPELRAKRLYYLLSVNNRLGEVAKAMSYADSCLALFEEAKIKTKQPDIYCMTLLQMGELCFKNYNYDKANDLFFKAKQFAFENTNACTQKDVLVYMGYVLYRQKKYQEAAGRFKQAIILAKQCTQSINGNNKPLSYPYYNIQEYTDNVALCYSKLNKRDSAVFYYKQAINVITTCRDSLVNDTAWSHLWANQAMGVITGNLAKEYGLSGDIDTAIALSKKSIALNEKICCEQRDAQLVQVRLIGLYFKKHDLRAMQNELWRMRANLDTLSNADAELQWCKHAVDYYDAIGQPAKALAYYKQFIKAKDSLYALEKKGLESDLIKDVQLKTQTADLTLLKKDNQIKNIYLWLFIVLSLMAAAIGVLVYINFRKSRENVKMLESLNQKINAQKEGLELANREKDRILNVVAHDLRNPVGGMAYMSDIALMEDDLPANTIRSFTMIKNAASSSLILINELLGLNVKQNNLQKAEVDLIELIKENVALHTYKANAKKQHLIVSLMEEPLFINIDKERINRLLGNLITNAIKFSGEHATVKVSAKRNQSFAEIQVKDEGIGIPEEQLNQVFEIFTSVKRKGTGGEPSFGLGLSICKQIAEEHDGSITVESEEGKGTAFIVLLPLT